MRRHIVKRRGKGRRRGKPVDLYYLVYQVGQRQKWEAVPEPRTRKHAEKLLTQRLQELHAGTFVEPKEITFGDFKDVWMRDYAEGEGEILQATLELLWLLQEPLDARLWGTSTLSSDDEGRSGVQGREAKLGTVPSNSETSDPAV